MIRVLLADDDPLVRTGLRLMLRGAEDLEVVGEAEDGARAKEAVRRLRPDVVLMDIRMPGVDGIAERVASCGGQLSLGPTPAGGFSVTARLPVR